MTIALRSSVAFAERSRELRGRLMWRSSGTCKPQRSRYAVACSNFAYTWQVGASRSVSRKRSNLNRKRKEADAVNPPVFFCERIVPFILCLLVLSTTRVVYTCTPTRSWKHWTVAPRMHVTGESFAIRVSHSIGPTKKKKTVRKNRACKCYVTAWSKCMATRSNVQIWF